MESALAYYERFLRERGQDLGLRLELAEAHFRIGVLHNTLGSSARGLSACRQALALYRQKLREDLGNVPLRARVAYHSPCHLGHAQRMQDPPRALLRSIPGIELVEIPDGDQCCGSAGVYNVVEPGSADEIGRRKAAAVASTGAVLVASANPGCSLQITRMLAERGAEVEAAHPVEILDRSIRGG